MTVSHHHATGASSVRVADARASDGGAKPNSSNTPDDIQPSQDSRVIRFGLAWCQR